MRDLIELSNECKDEKAFKKEIAKDLKKTIASMQEETLAEAIESVSANVKKQKYEITLSFDFCSNQVSNEGDIEKVANEIATKLLEIEIATKLFIQHRENERV